MITFLILLLTLIVIAIVAVLFIGVGGGAIILIFGDVIIAGFIVYMIIRAIIGKRK